VLVLNTGRDTCTVVVIEPPATDPCRVGSHYPLSPRPTPRAPRSTPAAGPAPRPIGSTIAGRQHRCGFEPRHRGRGHARGVRRHALPWPASRGEFGRCGRWLRSLAPPTAALLGPTRRRPHPPSPTPTCSSRSKKTHCFRRRRGDLRRRQGSFPRVDGPVTRERAPTAHPDLVITRCGDPRSLGHRQGRPSACADGRIVGNRQRPGNPDTNGPACTRRLVIGPFDRDPVGQTAASSPPARSTAHVHLICPQIIDEGPRLGHPPRSSVVAPGPAEGTKGPPPSPRAPGNLARMLRGHRPVSGEHRLAGQGQHRVEGGDVGSSCARGAAAGFKAPRGLGHHAGRDRTRCLNRWPMQSGGAGGHPHRHAQRGGATSTARSPPSATARSTRTHTEGCGRRPTRPRTSSRSASFPNVLPSV